MLRLVKAWPHEWLLHSFRSSAGLVKGSTGRQFWVKSGLSLAKGLTKRITFREKGHLAKTMLFTMFSYCLGRPWQALGSSGVPMEVPQEAKDTLVPV